MGYFRESGVYKISNAGRFYLEKFREIAPALHSQGFSEKDQQKEFRRNYEELIIEEGTVFVKNVKARRRSRQLTELAREHFKKIYDKLFCVACGFDFENKYDGWGSGYIEIHHTRPIHEYDIKGEKRRLQKVLEKLLPLCSNCHRMIHRNRSKLLSLSELKTYIKKSRPN